MCVSLSVPSEHHMISWASFCLSITGTFKVKAGLAQMAKGGIIMDVTTAEEATVAENAGVSLATRHLEKSLNV